MVERPLPERSLARSDDGLCAHYPGDRPPGGAPASGKDDRRPAADGSLHRTTYGEVLAPIAQAHRRARSLGVSRGDRVATFCWNHHQHLEAYYAVPSMGAVAHMLNIRLHADELAFIANHAGDSVVIVDQVLLPQFEKFRERISAKHVIVVGRRRRPVVGARLRDAARRARPRSIFSTTSTRTKRRACATRPARPGARRACCTRTDRRRCIRWRARRGIWSSCASATRCSPWCRCSTRTRGAFRTPRCCSARRRCSRALSRSRSSILESRRERARHGRHRRADVCMAMLQALDAEPRASTRRRSA